MDAKARSEMMKAYWESLSEEEKAIRIQNITRGAKQRWQSRSNAQKAEMARKRKTTWQKKGRPLLDNPLKGESK